MALCGRMAVGRGGAVGVDVYMYFRNDGRVEQKGFDRRAKDFTVEASDVIGRPV